MKKSDNKPDKNFINLNQARTDSQRKVMEKILTDGVCPFCPENLKQYHKEPILKEGQFWILTKNQWPYENVKVQLLAIHKTHIEHINELTPEASAELFELFKWAAKEYKIPGGAVTMRFGSNPEHGNYGSSVSHLHAHLIEADLENPKQEKIYFKIGHPKGA
jgi:diadenosine tetraphosphate (Ap4A) HIT family hydrolase